MTDRERLEALKQRLGYRNGVFSTPDPLAALTPADLLLLLYLAERGAVAGQEEASRG